MCICIWYLTAFEAIHIARTSEAKPRIFCYVSPIRQWVMTCRPLFSNTVPSLLFGHCVIHKYRTVRYLFWKLNNIRQWYFCMIHSENLSRYSIRKLSIWKYICDNYRYSSCYRAMFVRYLVYFECFVYCKSGFIGTAVILGQMSDCPKIKSVRSLYHATSVRYLVSFERFVHILCCFASYFEFLWLLLAWFWNSIEWNEKRRVWFT